VGHPFLDALGGVTRLTLNWRITMNCRFCNWRDQGMVKYGPRHYAHYRCYLEKGKSLADLHDWQLGEFPARLLFEFNQVDRETLQFRNPVVQAKFEKAKTVLRALYAS
jgi:hypothetical protein